MLTWIQMKLFFMAIGKILHLRWRAMTPVMMVVTWGGAGHLRPASGTWGTLATIPFAIGIQYFWGAEGLAIAALVIYALGYIALRLHLKNTQNKDPSYVVIDEAVGIMVALIPARFTVIDYVVGFILFRAFDALKPGPVGYIDKNVDGPHGILLDDVIAGLMTAVSLVILHGILWAFGI
jgi:phosphatidylglycerophosphatase A